MRTIRVYLVAFAIANELVAQSPCPINAPPGALATLFAGTDYPLTPDPTVGANVFFDVTAVTDLSVHQIEVNLIDDGLFTPNLVGMSTQLVVWRTIGNPGSWTGNSGNQAAWTQLATGTLTVGAINQPSTALFSPAFTLPQGSYGIALQHLPVGAPNALTGPIHPLDTDPVLVPTPLTTSDEWLTLIAGGSQEIAFTSSVSQPRVANVRFHYAPGPNGAYRLAYGVGCYRRPMSFYENSAVPPGTFDLANSSIVMVPAGNTYTVTPVAGAPTWFTPVSAPLAGFGGGPMGDDDISAPLPLPFLFSHPMGSSFALFVSSNGGAFLDPPLGIGFERYGGDPQHLLDDAPRHAVFWGDLDPVTGTGAGDVYFDVDPSNQAVYVTWLGMQEASAPGVTNTFQLVLRANGEVEYRYLNCAISAAPVLVGWSPGNGAPDPGGRDLSAGPFTSGDGAAPPVLDLSARPILGTTPQLQVSGLRPGTIGGFMLLGFFPVFPGLDLGGFGMAGCHQYVTPIATTFFLVSGGTASVHFVIPANPGLNGLPVVAQSAVLSGGLNPTGVLTSNGLCVRLGPH